MIFLKHIQTGISEEPAVFQRNTASGINLRALLRTALAGLILAAVLCSCGGNAGITGSPMLWSIDQAGYIRPRDLQLKGHYITEADVITISLNTIYLKYIKKEFADRNSHILIYTEVFDSPEEAAPYRTVVFNQEDQGEDSFLGVTDRIIYGPVRFKGFPVRVKLYVIELDKKDNEARVKVLDAIGSAVSAAQPQYAFAAHAGVSIGKILTAFNKDDYELRADMTFHPAGLGGDTSIKFVKPKDIGLKEDERIEKYPQFPNALNVPLRSGHYLLAKVESSERKDAKDVSKIREYLASSIFDYTNDAGDDGPEGENVLLLKSGYLWLDSICEPEEGEPRSPALNEAPMDPPAGNGTEEAEDEWEPCGTRIYDEKTYAVFSIRHGGTESDETKAREASAKQFAAVAGLLQSDSSEQIISGINSAGQSIVAELKARQLVNTQNRKVELDSAYRESSDFVVGYIDRLIGSAESEKVDSVYSRQLNASILRAIESTVRGFPLSSDLDSANLTGIDSVKKQISESPGTVKYEGNGIFRWKPAKEGQ